MSVSWLKPSQHVKDITRQQAEQELLEISRWLVGTGSKYDLQARLERVALIGIWFPKLESLCRQLARGAAVHPSSFVRSDAAAILGWLGNRNDYFCLLQLMSDKDSMVRLEAVESLFVVGERLALPHYQRILTGDYDEGMQRAALHGLDTLDDEGRFNYLINNALSNPELGELARGTAIDYQFRWFGETYIQAWLGLMKSNDYYAYMRPIWSLTESPKLFDPLSENAKTTVLESLQEFADRAEADPEYPRWQPKAARELTEKLAIPR